MIVTFKQQAQSRVRKLQFAFGMRGKQKVKNANEMSNMLQSLNMAFDHDANTKRLNLIRVNSHLSLIDSAFRFSEKREKSSCLRFSQK